LHLPVHLAWRSLYLLEIPEKVNINYKAADRQDQATKGAFKIISNQPVLESAALPNQEGLLQMLLQTSEMYIAMNMCIRNDCSRDYN
jgi:hypothetical protein